MKPRTLIIAFFVALAAAIAFRAPLSRVTAPAPAKTEIVAATFASAWCSSCMVLKPTLAGVVPDFKAAPVAFVEFDFTFGETEALAALAASHGMDGLYARNKGATGFTLLVDRDTGAVLDTLTMNFSEKEMRAAIERALAVATSTDEKSADEKTADEKAAAASAPAGPDFHGIFLPSLAF